MLALAAVAPLGYAVAAYGGARAARRVCRDRVAYADGPVARQPHAVAFALLGAILGAALALHGLDPLRLAVGALVAAALAGCAYADLRCGAVPDVFTIVPLGALGVSGALGGDLAPLFGAVIVAAPFALAAIASRGLGMGWGDVKLAALGGAVLGAQHATLALTAACVAAFLAARLFGRPGRPIAFAPFLSAAIACGTLGGIVS